MFVVQSSSFFIWHFFPPTKYDWLSSFSVKCVFLSILLDNMDNEWIFKYTKVRHYLSLNKYVWDSSRTIVVTTGIYGRFQMFFNEVSEEVLLWPDLQLRSFWTRCLKTNALIEIKDLHFWGESLTGIFHSRHQNMSHKSRLKMFLKHNIHHYIFYTNKTHTLSFLYN